MPSGINPLTPPTTPLLPPGPAALSIVLSLTFINSLGTGAVTNGVYFISKQSLGFGSQANFMLGTALGLTYIVGALGAGPALRKLAERPNGVSHRHVLLGLMLALGLLCFLPWLAIKPVQTTDGQTAAASGAWALWVFTLIYSPLTGAMWPIIESYLSGGRHGSNLRRSIGRFNICWACAIPVAYWGMAPLMENHSLLTLNALGVFHLMSIWFVCRLPRDPTSHDPDTYQQHPISYNALLALCRVLLPTSYVVFSVWSPYQPTAIAALGVATAWHTPLAGTWHLSRVLVFVIMERWQGWHGRWWLPLAGAVAMLVGFVGSVLAPSAGDQGQTLGIALLIISLVAFGGGMGAIYAAALYYAMTVGKAQVDAGGTHEALIGVGYTLGPVLGLGAAVASAAPWFPLENGFEPALIGSVLLICLVIGVWATVWIPRRARAN